MAYRVWDSWTFHDTRDRQHGAREQAQKLAAERRLQFREVKIVPHKTQGALGGPWYTVKWRGRLQSNPRAIKLPSKFTPAEVRVNEQGKVQIRINPAKLGSGGRFAKCVESVTAKGGAVDPRAVCAAAGQKKYGKRKFAAMARAGRKRATKRRK